MRNRNFGILTSMSWNSNNWEDQATVDDLIHSNYDYVKENGWMHEDLNFGYEKYPSEEDGTYIAYTPLFNKLPSDDESRYVEIVFFRSLDYRIHKNLIVGFYAQPYIGNFNREAEHDLYNKYDWGNLASLPENIVRFEIPIEISNEIVLKEKYLPTGKKIGQQGFNYLTYENVIRILDKATILNPNDNKLKRIKFSFLKDYKHFE